MRAGWRRWVSGLWGSVLELARVYISNVQNVCGGAVRGACNRLHNVYIIISDGITDAPPELVRQFARVARRTKLILVPPFSEHYWVQGLKRHGNVVYAKDVAQFEEAVKQLLTTAV